MGGLFKKAKNESAFLKMSLMGFQGSGKTFTATETAIGLIKYCQKLGLPYASKPVFFLDTEKASDWVIPRFERAGIEFYSAKTRAFVDLAAAMEEAEKEASLLLIDSLTHFWTEFTEAYKRKRNRHRGLEFQDWGFLKQEWRTKFTDRFIGSNLHVILCGRAGYEYEHYEDEAGKKQIEKSGIKMKAEGETGFEADLLVLMERDQDLQTKQVAHVATVMKDRGNLIDGQQFSNPGFAQFLPHIKSLAIGREHRGIDTDRTSDDAIPAEKYSRDNYGIQREIVLDELEALLVERFPSQSAVDKQAKAGLVKQFFGTTSWTEIQKLMKLDELRANFDQLYRHLNDGAPSRYTAEPDVLVQQTPIEEDGVPEFGDKKQEKGVAEEKQAAQAPAATEDRAAQNEAKEVDLPVCKTAGDVEKRLEAAPAQRAKETSERIPAEIERHFEPHELKAPAKRGRPRKEAAPIAAPAPALEEAAAPADPKEEKASSEDIAALIKAKFEAAPTLEALDEIWDHDMAEMFGEGVPKEFRPELEEAYDKRFGYLEKQAA